jgi:hypothetical protein
MWISTLNNPAKLGAPWVVFSEEDLKFQQSWHDLLTKRLVDAVNRIDMEEWNTIINGKPFDLYREMQHRMDYNRDYEDGKPKHRLTAYRLDFTDVRYFDSYGYLLHAGVGEIAKPPKGISVEVGNLWDEGEDEEWGCGKYNCKVCY